ncbi:MAG TPA: 1-(5-phosphoribosyl)-5-[(5-phosphoribosylamino)methylideneamino]imidazole-4-carboxamide isomerase [Clostridiales bacterium]|nr:1-(5-phosphoribosyl)-5-[(5-phosphoribosylamino)methylideneamino]imidazole-4-carboxamide isomerase [Clostridiales bacterium]
MTDFQILPAIDLIDGQCVRLVQGDYSKKTVFADDPVAKAKEFLAKGAHAIHLVDLDGAKAGYPVNQEIVKAVRQETGMFAEIGGGIRTMADLEAYLDAGIDRVILGTAAVRDKAFLTAAAKKYGRQIAVGIDAKDGKVAIAGWAEKSDLDAFSFAQVIAGLGIATIIYTDISRDGMLAGPNLEAMAKMASSVEAAVIASGGVTKDSDVAALKETGVSGVIIGKAIYTGDVKLEHILGEEML